MAVTLPSYPNDLDEFTNEFTGAKYYYDNGRTAWIFNGEGGATVGGATTSQEDPGGARRNFFS